MGRPAKYINQRCKYCPKKAICRDMCKRHYTEWHRREHRLLLGYKRPTIKKERLLRVSKALLEKHLSHNPDAARLCDEINYTLRDYPYHNVRARPFQVDPSSDDALFATVGD